MELSFKPTCVHQVYGGVLVCSKCGKNIESDDRYIHMLYPEERIVHWRCRGTIEEQKARLKKSAVKED